MKIAAVVLNHHSRHWPAVGLTIESLLAGTHPPDHVVIVDNHSGDGPAGAIAAGFPDLELIESPANRGYTGGMNLGIERALQLDAAMVLLVTHDCRLGPTALDQMAARLSEAAQVGVVGPLLGLASDPQRVFSAGGTLDSATWEIRLINDPPLLGAWEGRGPHRCQWLEGCCLLLRSEALRQVGSFDDRFFIYFEDVDHHLRLRSHGWDVECVPAATAWKDPGVIPLGMWVRNQLFFLARHAPARVLMKELLHQVRSAAGDARQGDFERLKARLQGLGYFAAGRGGPIWSTVGFKAAPNIGLTHSDPHPPASPDSTHVESPGST